MSSKRAVRRRRAARSCGAKRRHGTQAEAVAHLISLRRAGETGLQTYRCRVCGAWHVGHYR